MDTILTIIDMAVFYETDRLLKTGMYLHERIDRIPLSEIQYWELKESLLIAFFELEHILKQGRIPEHRFAAKALCRIVLEAEKGSPDVEHFCLKGLLSNSKNWFGWKPNKKA